MEVKSHILERAGMACSITGGLMGVMGCGLGCGIYVVWVEREEKFVMY